MSLKLGAEGASAGVKWGLQKGGKVEFALQRTVAEDEDYGVTGRVGNTDTWDMEPSMRIGGPVAGLIVGSRKVGLDFRVGLGKVLSASGSVTAGDLRSAYGCPQ